MCVGTWSKNRQYGSIDNVRYWMARATGQDWANGMRWYPDANKFVDSVVRETGIDGRIVAAVLSALSPNNPWERLAADGVTVIGNKYDCRNLVAHYASGGTYDDAPKVCTFNENKKKAWSFLFGKVWANGNKTTAFVDNITNPVTSQLVTVDIWAVRVWLNNSDFGMKCDTCVDKNGKPVTHGPSLTDKDYATISAGYAEVAAEYGILPSQCQAICWVAMKNETGR